MKFYPSSGLARLTIGQESTSRELGSPCGNNRSFFAGAEKGNDTAEEQRGLKSQ